MSNQLLSNFYQQVNPDNTMSFNRLLAHSIGIAETIIYYSLIGKYYYYLNREMIDENGWFYVTVPDLQESTSYGEKGQRNAINHLERLGFICTAKKGVPAKRYFRIVDDEKLYQEHLANGKRICEEIKSKAAETCERKIAARNAEKNKNNEKSALNAVEFQFRPLDGTSSAEFENKEKVLQSPKNSSSVQWTEQVTSKGRNKSRPNGGTSDVQTADKSKTNKSKTNKYNINLSIKII